MIVTPNRDTAEWLAMFHDVLLAQSTVDRLRNTAYDFVVDGESDRPKLKPKIEDGDPPPSTPAMKSRPRSNGEQSVDADHGTPPDGSMIAIRRVGPVPFLAAESDCREAAQQVGPAVWERPGGPGAMSAGHGHVPRLLP